MASTQLRHGGRMRRILGRAHLWLGLALGFVWALQGLTGAVLVFHRELDRIGLPDPQRGEPLSLERLLAAARPQIAAHPQSIGLVDADPSLMIVNYTGQGGGRRGIVIDAATGKALALRDWRPSSPAGGSAIRWLYDLHHRGLAGATGSLLLGASGLLLLGSAAWGLWLAWPRRGAWRAAFALRRWRSRAQRLRGWHRLIGLWAGAVLIVLAITGAAMDFGTQLRDFSDSHLTYHRPFTVAPGPVPARIVTADRALAAARARLPQAAFVSVTLPGEKLPVYQVRLRQPGEWRVWSGTSMVIVDPASGRILDAYDAPAAPLANRLLESAFAVHSGEAAGLAGRLAIFLAGLSLPVLYVSGVWSWIGRRRGRQGRSLGGMSGFKSRPGPSSTQATRSPRWSTGRNRRRRRERYR